jgi:hypothetical protein
MLAQAEALEADIDMLSERTAELVEPWTASRRPGRAGGPGQREAAVRSPVVANQRHGTGGARRHSLDRR